MKKLALLAFAAVLLAGPAAAQQATAPVVVELFTSQGCSSCPPADRLLQELSRRDDLITLSFNVDYWDYIGWKDTLAAPEHSARQRAYAHAMAERRVYTPQIVVDGATHVVGSDRHGVARAIERRQVPAGTRLPVTLGLRDDKMWLTVAASQAAQDATIWLIEYDYAHEVAIGRGENSGRTVTYTNVVRELRRLGEWHGEAVEMALGDGDGHDGCVVLVQQGTHGPVLGAARLRLNPSS